MGLLSCGGSRAVWCLAGRPDWVREIGDEDQSFLSGGGLGIWYQVPADSPQATFSADVRMAGTLKDTYSTAKNAPGTPPSSGLKLLLLRVVASERSGGVALKATEQIRSLYSPICVHCRINACRPPRPQGRSSDLYWFPVGGPLS
jgi:hypothetical protein